MLRLLPSLRRLPWLLLPLLALAPAAALADTVDNFTFTFGSDTSTFSLSYPLLGLPATTFYPPPQFYVDVPIDKDGTTQVAQVNFYGEGTHGGLQIEGVYAQGPFLFRADPTSTFPLFTLGTTNLTVLVGPHLDPEPASITITEATTAVTPEPSTLALLTAGLPLAAYLRRRVL